MHAKHRSILLSALLGILISCAPAKADTLPSTAKLRADQWNNYCQYFHDPDNNNGWSTCAAAGTKPNADVDIEGLLFAPTIPLGDPDTYVAVRTMLQHLMQPAPQPRLNDNAFDAITPRERVLWQRHISGVRSIAYDTVANIVGRRMPIAPTVDEQVLAWTPVPPLEPVIQPDVNAADIPPNENLPRFDTAIGDGLAYVMQRDGNLDGGQCPDNANQSCGFFSCQPAINSTQGATCIGRPASSVAEVITSLPPEMIEGRHILLSSGLAHQASDCDGGTSPYLADQLRALGNLGALSVIVAGVYNGTTLGENQIDLTPINDCIQQTISAVGSIGSTRIAFAGGFDNSNDHMIPSEPYTDPMPPLTKNYYTNMWLTLQSTGAAPSTTNPAAVIDGVTSCPDGSPSTSCAP